MKDDDRHTVPSKTTVAQRGQFFYLCSTLKTFGFEEMTTRQEEEEEEAVKLNCVYKVDVKESSAVLQVRTEAAPVWFWNISMHFHLHLDVLKNRRR